MLTKIKTIRSHNKLFVFICDTETEPVGYLARSQCDNIPSPYRSSPVVPILRWNGRDVVWFETSHRHYEVFEVQASTPRFTDWNAAEDFHIGTSQR